MPLAKTREKQKEKLLGTPDFYKPDIDNLIKMVLDCANKILYNDDAQITAIITKKIYGDPPRTEFTLRTLKDHYKGDFKTLKRIK
jgi:Holliday junction resolvase RusA-like endonuclease